MPLLFNGYQEPDINLEIDRRKPHSNLPPGQHPQQLNGSKRFLEASDDSSGDDDSGDDDSGDGDSSGSEQDDDNRVWCRHLALHYCRQSQENPHHVPQASDLSALRRLPPRPMEEAMAWPRKMSKAFHFVCGRDFGLFLHHFFNQMRRDLSPEASTAGPGVLAQRVFWLHTGCHSLSLRLR